ncbi:histidinol-phosphate transaminase [Verrucomicrobiota bacterium]
MKTFSDIANEGIGKLATYEPGRPIEEVARELGIEDPASIVKLASNENALGTSPKAVAAMREAATEMYRYPDGGAYYLKQALADRLELEPAQLLHVNGSNEALELLAHVFLGPGANVVVAEYAFIVYRLIAASSRADVVSVPMREFTHDLPAMLDAITPDTRIVFVSNPNNPTGTMVDGAAIERFMDSVPDYVVTCFDEAYIELLPSEMQPDTLRYVREGRKVVVTRTFSKTFGLAGLRIGYVAAPGECISLLNRVRQPFNVNAMAMVAAIAALGDTDHVKRTVAMVREGLAYLEKEFEGMGLPYVPAVANFMLVETGAVAPHLPGRRIFEALQRKGLIVRAMDGYGLPQHVRVTVGTKDENERLVRALREVVGG